MAEQPVTVAHPQGLHARPAALFVAAAARSGLAVTIARPDGQPADARSILSVLALDIQHGEQVVLRAEGRDSARVLADLGTLLSTVDGVG